MNKGLAIAAIWASVAVMVVASLYAPGADKGGVLLGMLGIPGALFATLIIVEAK
jgi:hypothetical protein